MQPAPDWVTVPPPLDAGSAWARYRTGVRYALLGARLVLTYPRLWPFVVAPALINAGLLVGLVLGAWWGVPWLLAWLWEPDPATTPWIATALWTATQWLLVTVVIGIAAFGLYLVSGIIAGPFLDRLSERVEAMVLGSYEEPTSLRVIVVDLLVSTAHTILGLLLWAVVMVLLLTLNLVPVIGSILELVLSVMASAFLVARETMDGPMSRRRLSFGHKLRIVWSHLTLFQGLGQVSAVMLWVPLLNFVALPMAAAGGTLLFCHLELQGLLPDARGEGPLRSERRRRSRAWHDDPTEEVSRRGEP